MSEKKPDGISPIQVSKTCWMYAEAGGLCVVQEAREDGSLIITVTHTIPWSKIEKAIKERAAHQDTNR